jgi:hypothetical protein
LEGVKDYEDYCLDSAKDVEINIKKDPPISRHDDFLKI